MAKASRKQAEDTQSMTLKKDLELLSWPWIFGYTRWCMNWVKVSYELVQDLRARSFSVLLSGFRLYLRCYSCPNQTTFIGLGSSKNYFGRPRLLQTWYKGVIRQGGTSSEGGIGRWVRGVLQGIGAAIVHPVATWISPPTWSSQSPLTIYFSTGLLERWTHVDGHGFNTSFDESWKYDREAQRLRRIESREGRAFFYTHR